jgi:hypothetical protein
VRDESNAHRNAVGLDRLVIYLEAVGGDRIYKVRVLQGRCRGAQARRLVVARRDEVGDVLACHAEGLFQETDDHMRRGSYGIEDVAGMDNQVHIAFQDGVDSPPVSLLDVHLPLVAASLLMELRVPRISQVSIRDVGYADYVPAILTTLDLSNSNRVWRGSAFYL